MPPFVLTAGLEYSTPRPASSRQERHGCRQPTEDTQRDALRSLTGAAVLLLTATLLGGCTPSSFTCSTDLQCRSGSTAGKCAAGYCASPDTTCASGIRYDDSAGGGLAGTCVVPVADARVDDRPSDASPPAERTSFDLGVSHDGPIADAAVRDSVTGDMGISDSPGSCIDATPGTLASGLDHPLGIAVDSTNIYWANGGSATGTGSIMKMPLAGGCPVTLAARVGNPQDIVVSGGTVYWVNGGGCAPPSGSIMQVLATGGTPTAIAPSVCYPGPLVADSSGPYWIEGWVGEGSGVMGSIQHWTPSGGVVTIIGSLVPQPFGLAIDSTYAYWSAAMPGAGTYETGLISRTSKSGVGSPMILVSAPLISPESLAVDAANIYFTAPASVYEAPLGGGTATLVTTSTTCSGHSVGIAADSFGVAWALDGMVGDMPAAGTPITVLAKSPDPFEVALDASHVYWTDFTGTVQSIAR